MLKSSNKVIILYPNRITRHFFLWRLIWKKKASIGLFSVDKYFTGITPLTKTIIPLPFRSGSTGKGAVFPGILNCPVGIDSSRFVSELPKHLHFRWSHPLRKLMLRCARIIQLTFSIRQPHKMAKQTQTIRRLLQTNCSSVFDHFVRLALKALRLVNETSSSLSFQGWEVRSCHRSCSMISVFKTFAKFTGNTSSYCLR